MSEQTTTAWVQDPDTQQDGISQLNESNLSTIYTSAFGIYVHADATDASLRRSLSKVRQINTISP